MGEYWSQILSVFGMLAAIVLVLVCAYWFTRWAGPNLGGGPFAVGKSGGRLQVLDRALVGRDQALLVVKAGQRYLLLGCTPAGMTLLAELTREEGEIWDPPVPPEGLEEKRSLDFRALMQRLREKK